MAVPVCIFGSSPAGPNRKHRYNIAALSWRRTLRVSMLKAYVLMNTELGQEAPVVEALSQVNGIKEAYALYGIYDVIAEVEAESMEKIKEIVFTEIRRLENVRTTITLITYGEPHIKD